MRKQLGGCALPELLLSLGMIALALGLLGSLPVIVSAVSLTKSFCGGAE